MLAKGGGFDLSLVGIPTILPRIPETQIWVQFQVCVSGFSTLALLLRYASLLPRHLQNQFPKILAIEKLEQRLGERLDPDHDVFF